MSRIDSVEAMEPAVANSLMSGDDIEDSCACDNIENAWEGFVNNLGKTRKSLEKELNPDKLRKDLVRMFTGELRKDLVRMFTGGPNKNETMNKRNEECNTLVVVDESKKKRNFWQEIVHDFTKGDQKILRAVGRTALVNGVVALSAMTGGAFTAIAGYATGGAITAKRLGDGLNEMNPKEVSKSIAVYGCATSASLAGQAVAYALMIAVAGASIPAAAAVAFGVGCTSGITVGALSEWGVDHAFKEWDLGLFLRMWAKEGKVLAGPCEAPAGVRLLRCCPQDELVLRLKPDQDEEEDVDEVEVAEKESAQTAKPLVHKYDAIIDTDSETEYESYSDSEYESDSDSEDSEYKADDDVDTPVVKRVWTTACKFVTFQLTTRELEEMVRESRRSNQNRHRNLLRIVDEALRL